MRVRRLSHWWARGRALAARGQAPSRLRGDLALDDLRPVGQLTLCLNIMRICSSMYLRML